MFLYIYHCSYALKVIVGIIRSVNVGKQINYLALRYYLRLCPLTGQINRDYRTKLSFCYPNFFHVHSHREALQGSIKL